MIEFNIEDYLNEAKFNTIEALWFVSKINEPKDSTSMGHNLMLTLKQINEQSYWSIFGTEADCWKHPNNISEFFKEVNKWIKPKVISINDNVYTSKENYGILTKLYQQGFWLQPITKSYDFLHRKRVQYDISNIPLLFNKEEQKKRNPVIYTNGNEQWKYLQDSIILAHVDVIESEMNLINQYTDTVSISANNPNWINKLNKVLWGRNTLNIRNSIKL